MSGHDRTDEDRFRLMFERSADAILLLDTTHNVFVEYNQAALDMLRCSREELSALHPSELSPPVQPDGRASYEKANDMIATAIRGGSHRFEWLHRSPHRTDFPVEVLLTPIQAGDAPLLLVVWRDITDRLRAEEALRQAQKLESLGMLAGGIAHDFNNLLTAMFGNLDLARAVLHPDHPAIEPLGRAYGAATRAAGLTRQMLAYSGLGAFMVKPLDLNAAVGEMADLLAVSIPKSVRMHHDLAEGLPTIEADAAQLQQVILNLVTNAAEAIGAREGFIALRTRAAELDEDAIRSGYPGQAVRPGPHVVLEVRDTGCGIGPEALGRIFDPFYSTKQSGRGLGLSALRGILKAHRAGLRVESEVGHGTTFWICFPACGRAAEIALPPRSDGARPRGRGTVLLVDDEAVVREANRKTLEWMGFDVLEATDGRVALAEFQSHRGRIAWVLMDLTMPNMDGHAAFLELRRLDPDLPVVLTSGWAEDQLAERFAENPPTAFLPKPFTADDIEAVLVRADLLPG